MTLPAFIETFHFLRPAWLLALALLPLLLWRWRHRHAAAEPWRRACDPHLLAHLLETGTRRGRSLAPALFACGYVLAVLALAGPAFRQLPQPLARAESALIVALDLSDRMRAADLKPDRLTRARFKIADLLRARGEGQTALVAYAGDAFVVAPLTDDANSLSDLLAALTPETMPVGGQRADRAVARAQRLLADAGFARGDLLLVTDAVDQAAIDAARAAAAAGLRVSALGVGTPAGAPVPLAQGGFVQDRDGGVALARLDEDSLRELAGSGAGRAATLTIDDADLRHLDLAARLPGAARLREDERTRARYRDEGPWLLLVLLPLAALAFRRGWLACLLVLAWPAPRAEAIEWSQWWKRDDQRAWEALQAGDAQRAATLARRPELRGSAAYRAGDFAQATRDFGAAPGADAHYNRGNALAREGKFEQALAAYDEALQLAPDMEDALANRKAVEEWMQQQRESNPQDGEPSPDADDRSPSERPPDGPPQDGASGEQDPSASDSAPQASEREPATEDASAAQQGEQEQVQEQAQEDFTRQMEQALQQGAQPAQEQPQGELEAREAEKQQAVEQWLRRVPDDPGGLLRRKFALEYQRRLREGEGDRP